MTEREKMLSGLTYNSRDTELLELYHRCKKLLLEYNTLDSRKHEQRHELLKQLLEAVSENVWIEAPFFCDYGVNISIGKGSFINVNCVFVDNNKIKIGEQVLIGPGVHIYTASHPLKANERCTADGSYLTTTLPVTIGNKVWIGGNSSIFPGISIGDNTTIGAGSLVTKNIPANVLAYGNPCKIIKEL